MRLTFFKYTNDANMSNINIFSKENMTDIKFKSIVKKIKVIMKMKNIADTDLFQKFDVNNVDFKYYFLIPLSMKFSLYLLF